MSTVHGATCNIAVQTCNCRESGIPWHMHSLTDVHTLFGNPPYPRGEG